MTMSVEPYNSFIKLFNVETKHYVLSDRGEM